LLRFAAPPHHHQGWASKNDLWTMEIFGEVVGVDHLCFGPDQHTTAAQWLINSRSPPNAQPSPPPASLRSAGLQHLL
jgi:hypothetical protein